MSEPIATTNKQSEVKTGEKRVACNGPAFGKHPRVFLTMVDNARGEADHVVCPYCSQVFRYDAKLAKKEGAHH